MTRALSTIIIIAIFLPCSTSCTNKTQDPQELNKNQDDSMLEQIKATDITTCSCSSRANNAQQACIQSVQPKVFLEDSYFYKIFYGEWEIVSYLSLTRQTHSSISVIGEVFSIDQQGFLYAEQLYRAEYAYNIVPIIGQTQRHVLPDIDINEMGFEGNFFVYVIAYYFSEEGERWMCIDKPGSNFFILDSDTLIIDVNGGAFIAKRLNNIENHEEWYLPFP